MKNTLRYVFGALLIAYGVIAALNTLEITNVNVSFDGWWALFIIIPCLDGVFRGKDRIRNLLGAGFGVLLLLASRDVFDINILWKLMVPAIFFLIGIKIICRDVTRKKKEEKKLAEAENYDGKEFILSKLAAVFGGASCNLKNAVIKNGAKIDVFCLFGGADIFVPENVNIKISAFCLFGGVADKRTKLAASEDAPTLVVRGFCMFGGADIK